MAIYGRGQMLGSGINPESFKQDYSGFANAAATQAQGLANLGATIGGTIAQAGDYFKEQKEKAKSVDTASRIAGLISSKAPDLIPGIGELKNVLDDQEIPLSERIAAAESLFGMMNTGFEVNKIINQNKLMEMQMQQASATQGPATKADDRSRFVIPPSQ